MNPVQARCLVSDAHFMGQAQFPALISIHCLFSQKALKETGITRLEAEALVVFVHELSDRHVHRTTAYKYVLWRILLS